MKELLLTYLPFLLRYKKQFLFAFLGMVAFAVGTAGSAHLIKPILDDIFVNKDETMLALMPLLLLGVFALKGMGKYIQTYYTSYIGQDVVRQLRDKLVEHLLGLDIEFFKQTHSGELLSRVTNDITRIQAVVSQIIPEFFRELLVVMALSAYIIYASPKLALYFLIIMPLALYPLSILAKKMRRYSKLSQESTADMTSRLDEILGNVEVIRSHATEDYEANRFSQESKKLFSHTMKQIKTGALTSPVMEVLGAIAIGLVIYIGGKEVIEERMSVGSFFAFATALFMLYAPLKRLSILYNLAQDAVSANERMQKLLLVQPSIKGGKKELTDPIKSVRYENVSLRYGDSIALSQVTFEATRGETVALVGDSGAGKSSVVNLLVRFYDPHEGRILINGTDHNAFSLTSLRRRIAYVTQKVHIFNDTVAANVAYGEPIVQARIIEALKRAHAYEFVKNLPQGIDTLLQQGGDNLSGGQKQRIALARALYKQPDILILDEATAALDTLSEEAIKSTLKILSDDTIIFIIAHRMATIEDADKILVFSQGKIVCEGEHETLMNLCEYYQKLLNPTN